MSADDFRQTYVAEAQELLTELESALLELESAPHDLGLINRVFRSMHTIKGSGAMFGYDDIASFTHEVETVLDMARDGRLSVGKELLDLVLKSRDLIQNMVLDPEGKSPEDAPVRAEVVAALKLLAGGKPKDEPAPAAKKAAVKPASGKDDSRPLVVYRIRFRPERGVFLSGTRPTDMLDDLCALGECRAFAHVEDIPALDGEFDPESCYTWWDIILSSRADLNEVQDVFIFVQDEESVEIKVLNPERYGDSDSLYMRLGELLVERGNLAAEDLQRVLSDRKPIGEVLADAGLVERTAVAAALAEQKAVREAQAGRGRVETGGGIRVSEDKLDKLVDLVGELVILQSRLAQTAKSRGKRDRVFNAFAEELERLSDDMRYYILKMRMLPFGTSLTKFRRLVRDLSSELGKQVDLIVYGEDTELDKTVIDKLSDPMIHILRNSMDHGLETPDVRTAAGKNPRGQIIISARHAGGDVLITISDDGAGLNEERIRSKAVERGLIQPEAQLSREETWNLIFEPGFSTAQTVTGVSGRGVGMDVVKKGIEALSGSIQLESTAGKGTSLTIKLPLTLAIIDGLQIKVGGENYIIPLQMVNECVDMIRRSRIEESGRRIFNHRGEVIPYVSLREFFGMNGEVPDIVKIVVTNYGERRVGILVDEVIGQCQTVIKSLGGVYKGIRSVSGASISGDGSVILILDIPNIVQRAIRKSEEGENARQS